MVYPEYVSRCPACGDPIDFCRGHGEIGDQAGRNILMAHDDGDHSGCHPLGCDEKEKPRMMRAQLVIDLPTSMTLGGADDLIEKLMEQGSVERQTPSHIIVTWEAEDGWTLRGIVDGVLLELEEALYESLSAFRAEEAIERVIVQEEV